MNGNEIIDLARRTYMEELAEFVLKQARRFEGGVAEAPMQRDDLPGLFGGHYRADFIGQANGRPHPVDMTPDRRVRMDNAIDGMAGAARVRMEQIVWDDVDITHDAAGDLTAALTAWFERWYDPDDRRAAAAQGGIVEVIHSLGVKPGRLLVDFGSAGPNALWELVALLRDAGARTITIRETRPPPA